MDEKRVLSIDPGKAMGYALWLPPNGDPPKPAEFGLLKAKRTTKRGDILRTRYDWLASMIQEHKIEIVICEMYFSGRMTGADFIPDLRGVFRLACHDNGAMFVSMPSSSWKKCVIGHGKAKPDQVREVVLDYHGVEHTTNVAKDALDAYAIGLAYLRGVRVHE